MKPFINIYFFLGIHPIVELIIDLAQIMKDLFLHMID
jgi:hypothetical protein